jgi:hypothetical protein
MPVMNDDLGERLSSLGGRALSLDEARAMEGTGWDGDLDEMRDPERAPDVMVARDADVLPKPR